MLNMPQLEFFKTFIEKLGGTVPAGAPNFSFPDAKPSTEERLVFVFFLFQISDSNEVRNFFSALN